MLDWQDASERSHNRTSKYLERWNGRSSFARVNNRKGSNLEEAMLATGDLRERTDRSEGMALGWAGQLVEQ